MADDGKIHIALPSREAASAERLRKAFSKLAQQLAAQGVHAPDLATAFRSAAAEADEIAATGPLADFGGGNATWHDQIARSFNTAHVPEFPRLCVVLFEMLSGREVPVQLEIADMRRLGERLISDAKKLAALQVAAEGGK